MNTKSLWPSVLGVALSCFFSASVLSESSVRLEQMVVTASRMPIPESRVLTAVTVITREDMDRLQAQSVSELLRGQAGINISTNGSPGQVASLFLRGAESDQVLILLDGVRIGSASAGTTALQNIPVSQIERIEIVRGPMSSLYGSEAIGGVVQIFTRRADQALQPDFSIGLGSDETIQTAAGVRYKGDSVWLAAGVGFFDTQGYDTCQAIFSAGCYTDEPDDDGYQNLSYNLRTGIQLNEHFSAEIHGLYADSDSEFDGSWANFSDSVNALLGAKLEYRYADSFRAHLAVARSTDKLDFFNSESLDLLDRFHTERDSLSIQGDWLSDRNSFTLGVDYNDERLDSLTAFSVTSRDTLGVFGQYLFAGERNQVQLTLRNDRNEQFGSNVTGGISWGLQWIDGLRSTLSYATAFKAPTFNELYYPWGFGNPDLKPETAQTVEAGLIGDWDKGYWRATLFVSRIDDLIPSSNPGAGNINEARIHGFEVETEHQWQAWVFSTSWTLSQPINRSSDDAYGNLLPRRAEQSVRLDVDRTFERFSFGMTLRAEGRRYDDFANQVSLGGFATLDLRAEYRLLDHWNVLLAMQNSLDHHYQTAAYYNQAGRKVMLTLRYNP